MTERILGTPGVKRRRRLGLFAPLVILAAVATMLVAASSAPALNTNAGDYSIQNDVGGRNDEPGQKDLTLQGTDSSDLPAAINVLWNWDETSVGGGNTLDACTLFDTDGDGNANFAFCAIVGNASKTDKTLVLQSEVLYTCGDTRNDRCSSQIAVVSQSGGTECQLAPNSNTNPFGDNPDTRIFCTIVLSDVDATNAVLLNTCSYPSQQPNSDPSDCVLIPGKANPSLSTTTSVIPNDSATLNNATSGGTGATVTFELYKDANSDGICDLGEKVFSYLDSSAPFATNNSGDPAVNSGYTITTDGTYLWKVIYSGDDKNNGSTLACGQESIVVNLTP